MQIFTISIYFHSFGAEILETGIKRTNIFYGSQTPEVTKVLSIHGTVDPWHPLGILSDLNDQAPSILITGIHFYMC